MKKKAKRTPKLTLTSESEIQERISRARKHRFAPVLEKLMKAPNGMAVSFSVEGLGLTEGGIHSMLGNASTAYNFPIRVRFDKKANVVYVMRRPGTKTPKTIAAWKDAAAG